MIEAKRYLISGHVHGVGFRFFAEDAASREGVHGFVRNLPDGRVEVVAEGDAEALIRLERLLYAGPPSARVERVEIEAIAPTGRPTGFSIR